MRSVSGRAGGITAGSPSNVRAGRPCSTSRCQRIRLSSTPARLSAIDTMTSAVIWSGTTRCTGAGAALFAFRASLMAAEISLPSNRITASRVDGDCGWSKTVYTHGPIPAALTR